METLKNKPNLERILSFSKYTYGVRRRVPQDDMDLGKFSAIKHPIHTGSATPIRQKMRRTPLGFEQEEKTHLDDLLKIGAVQPSAPAWASPPLLVRKKDGKV